MLWGGDEMVYNVRVDENDWARCGYCGHKLFEILGRMGDIRIKCHSCKNINITEKRKELGINFNQIGNIY